MRTKAAPVWKGIGGSCFSVLREKTFVKGSSIKANCCLGDQPHVARKSPFASMSLMLLVWPSKTLMTDSELESMMWMPPFLVAAQRYWPARFMMVYWASAGSCKRSAVFVVSMHETCRICDDALVDVHLEHVILAPGDENLAGALGGEVHASQVFELGASVQRLSTAVRLVQPRHGVVATYVRCQWVRPRRCE